MDNDIDQGVIRAEDRDKDIVYTAVGPRIGEAVLWPGVRSNVENCLGAPRLEVNLEILDNGCDFGGGDEDLISGFLSEHLGDLCRVKKTSTNWMTANWPHVCVEGLRYLEMERFIQESLKLSGKDIELFFFLKRVIFELFCDRVDFTSYNVHRKIVRRRNCVRCLNKTLIMHRNVSPSRDMVEGME
jgi:hypothetical protein